MVERLNQTLKKIMFKILTEKQTYKWIDILDATVEAYNNKKHSTIKMTPLEAWKNPKKLKKLMDDDDDDDDDDDEEEIPKFQLGDYVRVSKKKTTFEKGYEAGWSAEVFRIVEIAYTKPITYKLNDLLAEPIEGSFYSQELQKTELPDFALIDKVLKERTFKGKKQKLVSWVGYDGRFNEWIDAKQVKNLTK
jgi:hypothetical protein